MSTLLQHRPVPAPAPAPMTKQHGNAMLLQRPLLMRTHYGSAAPRHSLPSACIVAAAATHGSTYPATLVVAYLGTPHSILQCLQGWSKPQAATRSLRGHLTPPDLGSFAGHFNIHISIHVTSALPEQLASRLKRTLRPGRQSSQLSHFFKFSALQTNTSSRSHTTTTIQHGGRRLSDQAR